MKRFLIAAALAALCTIPGSGRAELKHDPILRDLVASQLRALTDDEMTVEAIKAQNLTHAALSQADIDRLDQQWRSESATSEQPLIRQTLANALSHRLQQIAQDADGLYTEVIVMDNRGLNVGVSSVTSDYWQGDEDKWTKTFQVGPDAIFVDEIEKDESTQQLQSQVSFSIVDPATGDVIGAITFGINLDLLGG